MIDRLRDLALCPFLPFAFPQTMGGGGGTASPYTIDGFFVGGGGGAGYLGGGGGGGAIFWGAPWVWVLPGRTYYVDVGGPGVNGGVENQAGTDGVGSYFYGPNGAGGADIAGGVAGGGGGGPLGNHQGLAPVPHGRPGGSGGGGGGGRNGQPPGNGGAGTPPYGNAGGAGLLSSNMNYAGAGGGGSAGVGQPGTWNSSAGTFHGGNGGHGAWYDITGPGLPYAWGGAGVGAHTRGTSTGTTEINRGAGGTYGAYVPSAGLFILRYLGKKRGTGGIEAVVGSYYIHQFVNVGRTVFIA